VTRSPHPRDRRDDVVVVGAGVIGLSCAWRLAQRGLATVVVDPRPGEGASWAAAGMLAPVTEVHYGEEALLALNRAGAAGWPAFAAELEATSGSAIGHRTDGTLLVTADANDEAWAVQLYDFQRSLGLEVQHLNARRARDLEPVLSPSVRGALWVPGDHQVDNRLLLGALRVALRHARVEVLEQRVASIEMAATSVSGICLVDGTEVRAPAVVLAAGWASAALGAAVGVTVPVRPVKGQILRLRGRPGGALPQMTVRAVVQGASVYLVPRDDGTLVVGATVEEQGDDLSVTAGAVYELLRDARRVVPGVSEAELEEAVAGLRPGSPDNAPMIGTPMMATSVIGTSGAATTGARRHSPASGLVVATGHFRNGILLAPITADAVTSLVVDGELPSELSPFSPTRFDPAPGLAC
jgi:glycine oxidase